MSDDDDKLKQYAEKLQSEREQKQREKMTEALADWVWASEATCFVRRSDHRIWNDRQWRSHYAHLHPKGDVFSYVMRHEGLITKVERLCFEPYQEEFLPGGYNLWRPSGVVAKEGDAQWFLDHINYLFPDPVEADLLLDFLALLVREPWTKIMFFLLLVGVEEGVGKTAVFEVMSRLVGQHNVVFPANDQIASQFTEWQEGHQLAIVHELMMVGRQQVTNRLKPVATEPLLSIRVMYRAAYETPNRLNCVFSSNFLDAVKIANADRRWFILETKAKVREDAYYVTLWDHIRDRPESLAAVKWLLQHRAVKLNPHGKAPLTTAKVDMVEAALPDEEAYLLELLDEGAAPFDFDLVRRADLITAVQQRFPGHHRDLMGRTATLLKGRLHAVKQTRNTNDGDGRPKWHLWSVRNHEQWRKVGPTARLDAYRGHHHVVVRRDFDATTGD